MINKIKAAKPDVIFTDVVGGSNVAFYKQLKAAGIDLSKQALLTISVTEDEIDGIGGENIAGAYACMKYFQSLDNANNKAFVSAFKKMWGEKTVIGDVTQAAYLGLWLWKLTVEKAKSFDVDKIAAASTGVEFRVRPKATCASTKIITSGRRPGSARASRMVSSTDLRDGRSDRARSVPEGLPVSAADSAPFSGQPLPGVDRQSALDPASRFSRGADLIPRRRASMFGDYSIGDLGSIFVMQGFAGLILFSVSC